MVFSQNELDDIAIANNTYKKSNKEMDSIYHKALQLYANKKEVLHRIKNSQKYWQLHTNTMLKLYYTDYEADKNQGEYNICFADELNQYIRVRIDELKDIIYTLESNEKACGGTVKVTDFENPNVTNEPIILFYYSKKTKELDYNFSIKYDYKVFGYKEPNTASEKLFLVSIYTKDIEGNPYKCKYGAYYDPSFFKEFELKFDKYIGDFARISIQFNNGKTATIYIEKKYFKTIN